MAGLSDPQRLAALEDTGLLDSPEELPFDRITRIVARALRAPVALVSLVDRDRQFFKSSVGLPDWAREARETPLSHSFCQHVTDSGEPLSVRDAREHELLRDSLAIPDLGVVAYAGVPIVVRGQPIGSLCAIDSQVHEWSDEDRAMLDDMAAVLTAEIELREVLRRERRVAERLQTAMLPERPPQVDGLQIAARYRAARGAIGGDWYDVVARRDHVLLALGDVVGKGIDAAAAAAQLRHALRGLALEGHPPAELLVRLHDIVEARLSVEFSTAVQAELDLADHRLRWAGAGSLPLLLVEDGEVHQLPANQQPLLGAASGTAIGAEALLRPGAVLLMTTDGLIERPDRGLDEGLRLLGDVALGHADDPEGLCDAALEAFGADAIEDDVALLAVKVG